MGTLSRVMSLFILLWCVIISCYGPVRAFGTLSPRDPSSYSRPDLAIIRHLSLSLNVHFEKKVLYGDATLTFDVLENIGNLALDVSKIKIGSITIDGYPYHELQYTMSKHIPNVGSKLTILLPKPVYRSQKLKIRIKYTTDPSATGLTWVNAPRTIGKKYPYVFSQSSSIHARSILPCQDTPAVKFTYHAEVTAPEEFTVLMSALRGEVKNNKTKFYQPVPLPSNIFAIAVGVLESRTVGPRSKVWSEKEDVDRFAYEFAETEKYLQATEKICGPYDWTEYNMLVLPPSFPHSAMENPCMTFVSPTIVVGDRSLSNAISHEINHSWTGNMVSIKNFEHFWLKEAFAVFLERKITASFVNSTIEAKRRRDLSSLLGLQQLTEGVNSLGASHPFTKLRLDLNGVQPDEAFTIIPYEKGSLFLRYLEDLFGGPEVFDGYVRSYVRTFRLQSIDTDQFKAHFMNYFKYSNKLKEIDWNTWLDGTGMPPVIPNYDTTYTTPVNDLVAAIEKPYHTFSFIDVKNFNVQQMIYLLQELIQKPALPIGKLRKLGTAYKIIGNKNNEILYRWLRLNIRSRDKAKLDEVFSYLNSQGRLDYVRPLYKELYAWEEVRGRAINNFLVNERYMSHLTAFNLRNDLHLG